MSYYIVTNHYPDAPYQSKHLIRADNENKADDIASRFGIAFPNNREVENRDIAKASEVEQGWAYYENDDGELKMEYVKKE